MLKADIENVPQNNIDKPHDHRHQLNLRNSFPALQASNA